MTSKSIFSHSVSIFLKSVLACFMCLVMTMSITVISFNWIAQLIIQVFSILLFCSIPYSAMWELGSSDKNKVAYHHLEEDKLKGLKIGLIASIPCFLTYVALIVCKIVHFSAYLAIFKLINPHFMVVYNHLFASVEDIGLVSWPSILVSLLLSLLLPLVCYVSYQLGYHRISIAEKVIYKNGRKPRRRKAR